MNIEIKESGNHLDIFCIGSFDSIDESIKIKREFQKAVALNSGKKLNIHFQDTLALPSSVIGTMLELKEIENADISIIVNRDELFEALRRLTLLEILNVKKA